MAFTKITAAGIGSTETVTIDGLSVINDGSFGGNVSVAGTLTYEDVTNIDSVGLITARAGVVVGSGITLSKDGDIFATGVTTATTFVGSLTGAATQVTLADESSDTTCFPVFATGATGNLAPKTGTNLTFNSNTGALTATSFSGDGAGLSNVGVDTGVVFTDKLSLGDSEYINVGLSSDLQIHHDGSNSYIQEDGTGQLILRSWAPEIQAGYSPSSSRNTGETAIKANPDGSVDLYHNNIKTFNTASTGIEVRGPSGGSCELYLYADAGANNADLWKFVAADGGGLTLQNKKSGSWETNISATGDGGVGLYYDNTQFFQLTSTGVDLTFASSDTSIPPDKHLLIYNSNNGANTMAGLRLVATNTGSNDHYIFGKKHGAGNGQDLIISQNTNERVRFIESGGMTFHGDTAAANALDDYEEGGWTPTFLDAAGSNISGGVNASYTKYTKIGRYVHCTYYWTLGDTGKNGADISLRSLPFAPTSPIPTMGCWWYDGGGVGSDFVGGPHNMVTASGGQVALVMPSTTWQQAAHRVLQFNDMTNGRPIYGCFSYFA